MGRGQQAGAHTRCKSLSGAVQDSRAGARGWGQEAGVTLAARGFSEEAG